MAYKRVTGGHAGIYAENRAAGKSLAWRANERFLMCRMFKVFLVTPILLRCDREPDRLDRFVSYKAADTGSLYAPFAKSHLDKGVCLWPSFVRGD